MGNGQRFAQRQKVFSEDRDEPPNSLCPTLTSFSNATNNQISAKNLKNGIWALNKGRWENSKGKQKMKDIKTPYL